MNASFQAILGLYSIIIGLGVSKLLEGVKNHVVSGQTLRGNTLYVGMLLIGLLVHVTSWLSLWSLRNVETWSVWSFLLVMTIPLLLYLYSAITVPEGQHSPNMNAYYLRHSTGMHSLLVIAIVCNGLVDLVMLGHWPEVSMTVGRFAVVSLLLVCALNPRAMRLHRVILPMLVLGVALLVPFLDFPIR